VEILAKPWATALAVDNITGRALVVDTTSDRTVLGMQRRSKCDKVGVWGVSTNMTAGRLAPGDVIPHGRRRGPLRGNYASPEMPQIGLRHTSARNLARSGAGSLFKLEARG
jgi:hypothetical protein